MFFYKPSKIRLASLVASDTSSVIVFFFRRQHIRCRLRLLTNTPPDMSSGRGASRSIFLKVTAWSSVLGFVDVSHAIHKLTRFAGCAPPLGGLGLQALARLAAGACSFLGFLQRV